MSYFDIESKLAIPQSNPKPLRCNSAVHQSGETHKVEVGKTWKMKPGRPMDVSRSPQREGESQNLKAAETKVECFIHDRL
jgi:hypothetical protein